MLAAVPSTNTSPLPSAKGGSCARGFLHKLMAVTNDPSKDSIQWTSQGSVVGIIPDKFSKTVLKTAFQGNKMESFKRKLCRWGFQRVLSKQFELAYRHPKFQQGKEELLASLLPRKQAKISTALSPVIPASTGVAARTVAMGEEEAKKALSVKAESSVAFRPVATHAAAASHSQQALVSEILRAREIKRLAERARLNQILASTSLVQQHQDLVDLNGRQNTTVMEELAYLQGVQQASTLHRVRLLQVQDNMLRERLRCQLNSRPSLGGAEPSLSSTLPFTMPQDRFQGAAAQPFGLGSFLPSPGTPSVASLVSATQSPHLALPTVQRPGSLLPAAASLLSQTNIALANQFPACKQATENHFKAPPQAMEEDSSNRGLSFQDQKWNEMYKHLVAFRRTHGHCMVPQHNLSSDASGTCTTEEDSALALQLARWVKRQRYQHKLLVEGKPSNLTSERIRMLHQIGFCWDSHSASWADRLRELKEFKSIYGDCNVPAAHTKNPRLASWVKAQRRQHKLLMEGKVSNMTLERKAELDKIGFQWNLRVSSSSSSSADMRR